MLNPLFTEAHAAVDGTVSAEESINQAFYCLKTKTKKVIENYLTR